MKTFVWFALLLVVSFVWTGSGHATDISGTITTTLTITDNSRLVGDVVCTVTGAPCIAFGASGLTLDLNGYKMTGPGDPLAVCAGSPSPGEAGILVNALKDVVIRGLGIVQQFRFGGILLQNSTGATVTGVTTSTNCFSGVFVIGGSDNLVEGNVSVRNGHPGNACGGI
jgi:hypothetical protein